jgi:hypothetical protein
MQSGIILACDPPRFQKICSYADDKSNHFVIGIIGRPNSGKSYVANKIIQGFECEYHVKFEEISRFSSSTRAMTAYMSRPLVILELGYPLDAKSIAFIMAVCNICVVVQDRMVDWNLWNLVRNAQTIAQIASKHIDFASLVFFMNIRQVSLAHYVPIDLIEEMFGREAHVVMNCRQVLDSILSVRSLSRERGDHLETQKQWSLRIGMIWEYIHRINTLQ